MPGASPRGTGCTGATYSLSRSCEYPRVGVRQKTNICANRFALIIAFTFLYVMQQDSKFGSAKKASRQLLGIIGNGPETSGPHPRTCWAGSQRQAQNRWS